MIYSNHSFTKMSKKHEKLIERQLIDIVNSRGNDNKCGECGASYPTWASWNLGIFLCGRCASIHRRMLGGDKQISKVKSLTLDQWSHDQVDNLKRIGNKRAKRKWNSKREPFPFDDDDESLIEEYIRNKYVLMKYRDDGYDGLDEDDGFGKYSDDSSDLKSVRLRLRLNSLLNPVRSTRSRANSRAIPLLSHRKLTPAEQNQYSFQVNKIINNYGYTNIDRDSILESLLLGQGSIDSALDILEQDLRQNPKQEEVPPNLPKRPSTSNTTSLLNNSFPSQPQSQSLSEWWNGNNNSSISANATGVPAATAIVTGQPQIYQYTDPVTGQISYVDGNGQQYLDPSNPQHQQQINQQYNPQLIAQQTNKQNLMSLYNQPDKFTTGVAIKVDPLQQQAQQAQPTQPVQQQQQFTGFQQPQQQLSPFGQVPPQQSTFIQQQPTQQLSPYGQVTQQQSPFLQQQPTQQLSPYGQVPQQQTQQTSYFPRQQQQYWG